MEKKISSSPLAVNDFKQNIGFVFRVGKYVDDCGCLICGRGNWVCIGKNDTRVFRELGIDAIGEHGVGAGKWPWRFSGLGIEALRRIMEMERKEHSLMGAYRPLGELKNSAGTADLHDIAQIALEGAVAFGQVGLRFHDRRV